VTDAPAPGRRPYLDWLRGVGVLIMIEGHALDAWTRAADRTRDGYQWAIMIAGLGAPLFLFLAGVAMPLAAGSRLRKGLSSSEVTRVALRRGAWILGLAFLFRLQSWVISGGGFPGALLKVDILNVMGVSMIAAALLWALAARPASRVGIYAIATALIAMATPIIRSASWPQPLPDPLEWYLRPFPGSTTFTLFPWAGFLTAGAALGSWLDSRSSSAEARSVAMVTALGALVAAAGYAASFLPPLYANTNFWTSSPTFFSVRLGLVIASIGLAYLATRLWGGRLLQEFGRASLFVYWIHVEMAYGVLSLPLHRRLPFEAALVALAIFAVLLFGLLRAKDRILRRGRLPESRSSDETRLRPIETRVP
jgi:uncharacterized membrane protein